MMKPQDVLVLLEIAVRPTDAPWRFKDLASDLSMSPSEIHAAIKRSTKAGLFDPLTKKPRLTALTEFLVHGLKYVFPAEPGTEVRGMPTAHSAQPLNDLIVSSEHDQYVWPTDSGNTRGLMIPALFRSAPQAAARNPALYELLALIDAMRVGRVREQRIAVEEITKRLRSK